MIKISWKHLGLGAGAAAVAGFVAVAIISAKPAPPPPTFPDPPPLPAERPSMATGPLFPEGLGLAITPDSTTSTLLQYTASFMRKMADLVEQVGGQPGQGSITIFVVPVGAEGANPRNSALVIRLEPTSQQPTRRATKPRPAKPDFDATCMNDFNRDRCRERLLGEYTSQLSEALADERLAQEEYEAALARFDAELTEARTRAHAAAEQLRNLALTDTEACSDVAGAINLALRDLEDTPGDMARFLFVQTDLAHNCGSSEPIAASEAGLDGVTVLFLDCGEVGSVCESREAWLRSLLTAAGAPEPKFYLPAVSEALPVGELLEVQ